MKNKISDVRNFLVQALEDLSERGGTPEEMAQTIERAKTISGVAGTYVQAVKIEIDALRLADDIGVLPQSVDPNPSLRLIEGRKAP